MDSKATSCPGDKFYEIPSYNMEGLRKRMAALAKRAAKLGCEAPGFVEHAAVDRPEYEKSLTWHIDGSMIPTGEITRSYILEVTGSAPAYAGWDFLASIDVMPEAGNLVRVVPGQALPEKYRTELPHCDHCNQKRNRINHYVVRNKETGEFKMVGSGCIRDFLGHQSPDNIAAMASFWASIDGVMEESSRTGTSGSTAPCYIDLVTFLSYVACAVGKFGWLSAGRAYEEDRAGSATKNLALNGMFHKSKECREGCLHPTTEDKCLAYTATAWAQTIEIKSDFDHNLHTIAQSEVLPYRGAGIAAAIIFCYKRHVEQEILREKRSKQFAGSIHVGEVGKRQEFTITVASEKVLEGAYGTTSLYSMLDESGNCIKWFSSSRSLKEGESYVLKGTVKAHEEFRGTKQTALTRCKIVKEIVKEDAK